MSVAIRTATRIQDMDDANVTPGVGVDEYVLTYDHDTAKFVLRAPFAGLLATGATVGATSQAQLFTNGVGIGVSTPETALQVASTLTTSPRGIMSSQHSTGVDGARFHMRKSRGTNAAPAVVVTGDVLGRMVASGYDGANYLEMGGIDIVSVGTIASTRVPTEMRFLTATDAAPSVLTQRMVIDKSGRVGIGTASPTTILDVAGTIKANTLAINNGGSAASPVFYMNGAATTGLYGTNTVIGFSVSGTEIMRISGTNLGIGTAPATIFHAVSTTAVNNALRNVLTLGANVTDTGVGAAGLGPGILFQAESSTTADTTQARITSAWIVATHASRTSRLALSAYDTAEREGIRIDSDGAAALLGFYAHAAVAQQVLATGVGATADNIITALQALGLVKQS